jgi:hypothetical protein
MPQLIAQLAQPLLADIGEVIGAVIGMIAFIAWIIQKVAEANKQAAPPRARPQVAPPQAQPQPAGQAGGMRPAGHQADALRDQVEEFLRRAGQGPKGDPRQAPQRRPQPVASEIEILLDEESAVPERRPLAEPLRPMASRVPNVAAADKRPPRRSVTPRKRKSLAERADERAAARQRSMAEQAAQLGQRIIHEDQQFDSQLKAKFDHAVGTLADSSEAPVVLEPAASDTPAGRIAAMLASPEGVQQAIVLNEILRPPTERW